MGFEPLIRLHNEAHIRLWPVTVPAAGSLQAVQVSHHDFNLAERAIIGRLGHCDPGASVHLHQSSLKPLEAKFLVPVSLCWYRLCYCAEISDARTCHDPVKGPAVLEVLRTSKARQVLSSRVGWRPWPMARLQAPTQTGA